MRRTSLLIAASGFIYAPTSSNNLGDRAQLTRTVERLRAAFPESRLFAMANSLNDEGNFEGLEVSYSAIGYLTSPITIPFMNIRLPTGSARALRVLLLLANARRLAASRTPLFLSPIGRAALREMEESSALFISGAGGFNDLYVSGVGAFWGVLVRCMSLLGKPVIASGQQVGPLERFTRRALTKWALHPVDLLGLRDPRSISFAEAMHVPRRRLVLTGDDAWDLAPASPEVAREILARNGIPEPFLAVQMRFGPSVGWNETDSRSFARSLGHLSSELGLAVVFVPCMIGRGADDRQAASLVQKQLDVASWAISEELDARTTKAILGRAALGVGAANHFCVFLASMGTPVIGLHATAYMKQKITGLAELWPNRVTALTKETGLQPADLLNAARRLLEKDADGCFKADAGRPAVDTYPDEPVRVLMSLLDRTPPRPYKTRFTEGASVETYARDLEPDRFMGKVSDLERRALRSALESRCRVPFQRHLDFACGTGRAMGFVDGLAEKTVGVDVSSTMLARAKERFPTAQFVCGDITSDPRLLEQSGPFDLVTVWRFIAPAEQELRLEALTAVARSMDDRGLLLVNNNANRTSLHGVALFVRSIVRHQSRATGPYRGALPYRQLCRILQTVGFQVEETRGICYLPEQITRRLPPQLWMPLERALGRLNIASQYAVNQLVIARRSRDKDEIGATFRPIPS